MILNDLCMIYWPSLRSLAYIDIMRQLHCVPAKVIFISSDIQYPTKLLYEWTTYKYDNYFNISFDPLEYLQAKGSETVFIPKVSSINDSAIQNILQQCSFPFCLFSGGGIIKKETLRCFNGHWIHIHPGILPEYRGSTCFYYSYLQESKVYASAFIMSEILDSGKVIEELSFEINYPLKKDQLYFLDYLLDSYIRAQALKKFLIKLANKISIDPKYPKRHIERQAYYVAHPMIRYLAIEKIKKNFNPEHYSGIHEIKDKK